MWTALTLLAGVLGTTLQTTPDPPKRFGAFLEQRLDPAWVGELRVDRERSSRTVGEDYFIGLGQRIARSPGSLPADAFQLVGSEWRLLPGDTRQATAGTSALESWTTLGWWHTNVRGVFVLADGVGSIGIGMDDMGSAPSTRFHYPLAIPGAQSLGTFGFDSGQFGEVRGLGFDKAKRLWVLDRLNHRVVQLELGFSHAPDVPKGALATEFLSQPESWSEDRTGGFYSAVWHASVLREFGSRGQGPGQFSYPTDLDIHDDRVYVTDRGNHRIQVFDLEGQYLYEWGIHSVEPGDGEGKLHYPESLAISSDGTVAVVHEPLLGRLQAFGLTDEPAEKFMTDPVTLTGLGGHMGPRFSVHGSKVAIFDPEAQRVQLYDTQIASVPIKVTEFGGAGTGPGQFMDLVDLAFDERGDLWILDRGTRSVAQLRANYAKDLRGFDARLMSMVRRFDLEALAGERESWCDWPDRLEWRDDGLWIGQGSSRWRLDRPEGERRWQLGPDSPQRPRSLQLELGRAGWEWNAGSAELGPHDLRKATDAAWVGEELWVLDFGHHRLLRYDSGGAVTAAIGPPSYTRPARRTAPTKRPVPEEE